VADDTPISWTHRAGTRGRTWNPTDGCQVCSPGCANCFAMRFAGRFSKPGLRYHGLVTIAKNKRAIWTGEGRFDIGKLAKPLSWKQPSTIFVNSMSDLFYEEFSNEQIAAVFGVMAACPQHVFQILTKRARRMREWFAWVDRESRHRGSWTTPHWSIIEDAARDELVAGGSRWGKRFPATAAGRSWPLSNVWLGTSTENQETFDERVEYLLACPAAIYFLSVEPLLGPIDASHALRRMLRTHDGRLLRNDHPDARSTGGVWRRHVDQVIVGAESGPGARPCDDAWLRSLRDQCRAAGVAFFVKQLVVDGRLRKDKREFPADLRIQEFPQ